MMYDLQKASLLKRFSAFLLDLILLVILITGFAYLLSVITGYDNYNNTIEEKTAVYEEMHGVSFDIAEEEYNELPIDEKKKIDDAYAEFSADPDVIYAYNMMFNLTLMITSISILLAYLTLELVVPLLFKNGQTVGKKIFSIGVMQSNGVKISGIALFTRTVLAKYALETMIPVIIVAMLLFGSGGGIGLIVLGLIFVFELVLLFATKEKTMIHDIISHTVVVDISTQLIFNSYEEMMDYKKRIHAEQAAAAEYK